MHLPPSTVGPGGSESGAMRAFEGSEDKIWLLIFAVSGVGAGWAG
jgi:hypothetical protein